MTLRQMLVLARDLLRASWRWGRPEWLAQRTGGRDSR